MNTSMESGAAVSAHLRSANKKNSLETTYPWERCFPAVARVRFRLSFNSEGTLPAYLGSTLRGALGHGLKRVVCVTGQRQCDGCLLQQSCFYHRFFETPNLPIAQSRRQAGTPHPWVLAFDGPTPSVVHAGTVLEFGLLLLDHSIENLPYLILAVERAGKAGLGRGSCQGRCRFF